MAKVSFAKSGIAADDGATAPEPGLLISPYVLEPSSSQVVLTVGTGEEFATLAQAAAVAPDGSLILVDAGTYTNDFATVTTKITIEGVGGMANFVATEPPPNFKGILTVDNNVTIENCGFSGCSIPDEEGGNGAGIRYEGGQMVLENDSFSNNQNGILGAPVISGLTNTVTVDHCLFEDNGSGSGYTHNFYMGAVSDVTFTNNVSEGAVIGHEFKSRALANDIQNNVFMDGPTGTASYEIDLPDGGQDTITNNYIEKGPNGSNEAMVHFGGEGIPYAGSSLLVSGNEFANDYGSGDVAVLNQTAISATITGNQFDDIPATSICQGPATETASVDGDGNALPDQTLVGVLPGSTMVFSDSVAHTVTLGFDTMAVEGGSGLLTATAANGHVVAIGGAGGLDFNELNGSGGNTVTTMAGSANSLQVSGGDLVDSQGSDTISCGVGNIQGLVAGAATISDGLGNNEWSVSGTATITGHGGNPVISIGETGYASVSGTLGFMHIEDDGGSFGFNISQGGTTEAVNDTGGALDLQVYNSTSIITTAGGTIGADLTLAAGAALVTSLGADKITAGSGAATIIVEGAATVYAGTGSLSLYGRSDTAGAVFYGNGGSYLIGGDTGNITYFGGSKASTVTAQLSRITLVGGSGRLTVIGGSDEHISGGQGGLIYTATDGGGGNNILTASGARDVLTLAGADSVTSNGNDIIFAGSGNQVIAVSGNSVVYGSSGNSVLSFAGRDTLVGVGNDWCTASAGATLTLDAGNFSTVSETGAYIKFIDAATASGSPGGSAVVTGGAATVSGSIGAGVSVMTAAGVSTSVTLGSGADNVVSGGSDTIYAGFGADTVTLTAANAVVKGSGGPLTINNNDFNAGDAQTVQGGSGTLTYTQADGSLNFIGGSGSANIDGAWGSLFVTGGTGNLQVEGGEAGLSLVAGKGTVNVSLTASGGTIEFGAGTANVQAAGWGAGNLFEFDAGHGGGRDNIIGFRPGQDTLAFNGVSIASETVAGGTTKITLSDNTHITLIGFADVNHLY